MIADNCGTLCRGEMPGEASRAERKGERAGIAQGDRVCALAMPVGRDGNTLLLGAREEHADVAGGQQRQVAAYDQQRRTS